MSGQNQAQTCPDAATLRRALYDNRLLDRTRDGPRDWGSTAVPAIPIQHD